MLANTTMMPFDAVFPDIARHEERVLHTLGDPDLPSGTYRLCECYCHEPACDCRRVLLQVVRAADGRQVATINYSFEPPTPPFEDEGQVFLDPLNPQSEWSETFLGMFEAMIANDQEYLDRLVRHYEMWKQVVDDPLHPDHAKVRTKEHDDPDFRPAFPRAEPFRRQMPKVGANDPCPCGSGQKYKKCCRA